MGNARDAAKTMSELVERVCQKFDHSVSSMQIDNMEPLTITVEVSGGMKTRGWFGSQQHTVHYIVGHYLEVIAAQNWKIEQMAVTLSGDGDETIEITFTAKRED